VAHTHLNEMNVSRGQAELLKQRLHVVVHCDQAIQHGGRRSLMFPVTIGASREGDKVPVEHVRHGPMSKIVAQSRDLNAQ